jgi:flagellar assembly factor FliW
LILEIQTERFGKITVREDKVITFPKGLLGFSQRRQFILFPHKEGSPFFWLQCIEDGGLAFVLMNPKLVVSEYAIDLDDEALKELNAGDAGGLDVLCIVTIPHDDPRKMTINLLGPIIINVQKMRAVQLVSVMGTYSHRHPVLPDASSRGQ